MGKLHLTISTDHANICIYIWEVQNFCKQLSHSLSLSLYIYICVVFQYFLSNLSHFVFWLIQNEPLLKSVELEDLKEKSSGQDQISYF